jgi:hypothetical protein
MVGDPQEKTMKMRGKSFRPSATFLIILLAAAVFGGCNRGVDSQSNTNNAPAPASPSPSSRKPQTAFERDLDYVRTGRFTYIYVIARKDGGVMNKEDIAYLKENAPKETNQWVSTDENRRVIAGTNFVFTPENLDALRKRFIVEDYSGR